ncbi:MAG: translation initiation factor IF-2, partial [Acidobacteria bacterium]|nr:translation initiation factor IF-2 [Acidobacteriota bacterium]
MATVRIYKVAEVLNTTSQEVMALLKRDHGIEVKSASSTIEEVVARQFVERLARQRGLQIPSGAIFADTPPAKTAKRPTAKAPEPPKPTAPALPPPRLVKTVKPPVPPPVEAAPPAEPAVEGPAVEVVEPAAPESEVPAVVPPTVAAGRIVPPTIRLRVEEPHAAAPPPVPGPPRPAAPAPAARVTPHPASPPTPAVPATTVPVAAHAPAEPPAAPRARPAPVAPLPPAAPRPAAHPIQPAAPARLPSQPLGGPRPLPSQPIRTPSVARPGGLSAPAARPAQPVYRPMTGARPGWRPAQRRPAGLRERHIAAPATAAPPPITHTITLAEGMTVKDLADKLEVKAKDVLRKLLDRRLMMTINTTVDHDTAISIARDFGADVQMRTFEEEMLQVDSEEQRPEDVVTRAPVVTVMGHVDHGKTTLLDAIRETRVAEREAGGITQHIGAYTVQVNDRPVVFLDTPGHEAFTMMRARGARVTDVVILVVAADDGVMPQTREAIDHARAAGVPIIVAINKVDKPEANPDRVKKELSDLNLVPEQWGGQTVMVEVSAKKKQNLELLLEMILLVTELGELKANPKRNATGTVLETKLDRGRGAVATILVQDGTLHVGDTFIAGTIVGRVRALFDDRGRHLKQAMPSTPVEVLGLTGLPQPGDTFQALTDTTKARQIALYRQLQAKEKALVGKGGRVTLQSLQQQISEGTVKELPIIIKADVQGSAEVLADTLTKLSDEKVKIRIIHAGVGAINESDVLLASASNAIIIGFNVRPDRNAAEVAERERVDLRLHSVIY